MTALWRGRSVHFVASGAARLRKLGWRRIAIIRVTSNRSQGLLVALATDFWVRTRCSLTRALLVFFLPFFFPLFFPVLLTFLCLVCGLGSSDDSVHAYYNALIRLFRSFTCDPCISPHAYFSILTPGTSMVFSDRPLVSITPTHTLEAESRLSVYHDFPIGPHAPTRPATTSRAPLPFCRCTYQLSQAFLESC